MSNEKVNLPSIAQADILIVDDVLENIRLLASMLECNGYQTRKAMNGLMALTAVEAALPDLILLDIRMPDMNGYEVCERLKSNPKTAHIPIVFLSAADEVTDKVQGFKVGGADYITKPFYLEEVLTRVQYQITTIAIQQTILQLNTQLEERVRERTQQLEIVNSQLSKMAFHDPLTQLPNRALLMARLGEEMEQQKTDPGYQLAVLYLDCDRFKTVNDSLGHLAGDELLVAISQRLQSALRPEDLLSRLGGDEFVVLLTKITDPHTVTQIAERILSRFASPFRIGEQDVFASFSIGIVSNCSTYRNPEKLLGDADTAMYKAKSSGRNQYQIFTPVMHQAHQNLQLETDLRKALQQQEFVLHYQPIVELATGTVVGAEALIRWCHPTQGLISPAQFIPIAEETGFILQLSDWVLREACRQVRLWQSLRVVEPLFSVSVNISACQFAQPNFIQQIDDILAATQLSPECLKLEITETALMYQTASAINLIYNLRERFIQLSIDDFGTGYSSLSYLHSFPVDTLKIDRSFIKRLHESSSTLGLVTAIVQIAKTMGMDLVAEGIETNEQLTQLKRLGCQFGQGYLFSRPLSSDKMANFFTAALQKQIGVE